MTKKKYGLWGIAILTPVLLSIPLGTFLANKYYRNKKTVLFSLTLSVVCWSIIMASIYILF
jgi:prolipoprotein diacylglyceryltransferase